MIAIITSALVGGKYYFFKKTQELGVLSTSSDKVSVHKKKILYVDSYHAGYPWSDGITEGVLKTLNILVGKDGKLDNSKSSFDLEIIRMDTKRNTSEKFKIAAAKRVKNFIDVWKPEIVIASDDHASKYLIVPYFKNKKLPFVFCGINWDASIYNYPFNNVTGMVEVALVSQLVDLLKKYSKGKKVAYLAADVFTARKEAHNYVRYFNLKLDSTYVKTYEKWKQEYRNYQKKTDILIVGNIEGINDWDASDAKMTVEKYTTIPTGSIYDFMAKYSLVGITKSAQEQGEWAAKTALEILGGKLPSDIPVTTNKNAKIFLNMSLAKKLKVVFPMQLIEQASFVQDME